MTMKWKEWMDLKICRTNVFIQQISFEAAMKRSWEQQRTIPLFRAALGLCALCWKNLALGRQKDSAQALLFKISI